MPTNVIMPALGVAQETGTLIHWRKAEGAFVTKGEPLMEVETDKATVEIDAPASGVLAQVSAK
ncbi:MAG: lipoyl domain-containing protein, partial [Deltaproteobacteria bacterium]|nr:lipoyl domain-containing protein [Deltaproteobacteria bacterium]